MIREGFSDTVFDPEFLDAFVPIEFSIAGGSVFVGDAKNHLVHGIKRMELYLDRIGHVMEVVTLNSNVFFVRLRQESKFRQVAFFDLEEIILTKQGSLELDQTNFFSSKLFEILNTKNGGEIDMSNDNERLLL